MFVCVLSSALIFRCFTQTSTHSTTQKTSKFTFKPFLNNSCESNVSIYQVLFCQLISNPFFHKNNAQTYPTQTRDLLDGVFFYPSFAQYIAWKFHLCNKSSISDERARKVRKSFIVDLRYPFSQFLWILLYRCYYLHYLRDSASPVCGTFFLQKIVQNIFLNNIFTMSGVL